MKIYEVISKNIREENLRLEKTIEEYEKKFQPIRRSTIKGRGSFIE